MSYWALESKHVEWCCLQDHFDITDAASASSPVSLMRMAVACLRVNTIQSLVASIVLVVDVVCM